MALVDEKDILLDSQGIATWEINMTGPIGGTYQGVFQFRTVLSPIQQIEADRDYRELLGTNATLVSTHVDNLAYSLSQLRQRVIKAPPFWDDGASRFKGSHIRDEEVIQAVYEAAVISETKFRAQIKEKHKASIERLKASIERQEEEERLNAEMEQEELNKEAKAKKKKSKKDIE
jgi:outer membrane scaffolding protein for murein synthesis (MipA/OmpV family)